VMRAEIAVLLVFLVLALGSAVIYAASPGRRATVSEGSRRKGSFALGVRVREWFYWFLGPVRRLALATRLAPDFFNFFGLVLSLASMLFLARGHLPAGGWLLLASGVTDILDGEVARARGSASRYGAFLDSTLDRFAELAIFVGLAVFYGSGLPVLLVVIALGGSLLVSYTRARGESQGVLCQAGIMQRAERMLALGFGAVLDPTLSAAWGRETGSLLLLILGVLAATTVATAVFRTVWISRELRKL
jgi:CDP-diacylglycerol--glycerol-3-phosphate 3-phosphatidyltransferase